MDLSKLTDHAIPMTPREKAIQGMSFVYGNLAASTHHGPVRAVFRTLCLERGWTPEEFDTWATPLRWREDVPA